MTTYLDAAATAPLLPEARAAMLEVLDSDTANPSSVHSAGHHAARVLEAARSSIATAFDVHPETIIFTSGGTEANNLGIIGRALANPANPTQPAHPQGTHIITTRTQHSSVLQSCAFLQRVHGFRIDYAPVDHTGRIIPEALLALIKPDTAVVAIELANAEVGTVNDINALPTHLLHLDAVQAAASLPVSFTENSWPGPHIPSTAIASHKFGGPQGAGALILAPDTPIEPLLHGGNQENGRRAGTENLPAIAGFAAAVAIHQQRGARRAVALLESRDQLIAAIEANVLGAQLTGHRTERLPGHASFTFPGVTGESLLVALDAAGIAASAGSACRAGQSGPSPVLLAMGYNEEDAQSALRFTLPAPLERSTIDRIVAVVRGECLRAANNCER